jgi:hypothetical protein
MANKETSIREWIKKFDNYEFHVPGTKVACEAGWYDWFCADSALTAKTKKLGPKVKQLAESPKVDKDKMYVFFKNNCPMMGRLYDDFRFCSIETGDVIYTITPRVGYSSQHGEAEVWGKENDFKEALVSGTWNDVKTFFNV